MTWQVGVDIGGTFTDLTAVRDDGTKLIWKVDTTPGDWQRGVTNGLEAIARELGVRVGEFLADVQLFVHGSTIATNTMIERNGPRIGLVCTRGFRDALYFRDGFKWDRFNIRLERPRELIPRHLRLPVSERILYDGSVALELDEASVRDVAARLRARDVGVIAVALLWAHVNPVHEHRVREILSQEFPSVPVLLSSDILPETGDWVRTSATAISAYVFPASATYLRKLSAWLEASGLTASPQAMQINGGCASFEHALRRPVSLIHAGPAAAPTAGLQVAQRTNGADADLITVDMGGTSFDVCLVQRGSVPLSRSLTIDHQPLGVPGVELGSVGAGGGSIAWVDQGGALHVGPQSAGARPGPAAYGQGGPSPTVTDANLVLGYLSSETFLGGRRSLRRDLAEAAIEEHVAEPLRISTVEAAAGVITVVNERMISAMRAVSIERGIDPRGFLVISGGGAGSLHSGRLAAALGIGRVLVPAEAGVLSSFGMTVSDVHHDYSRPCHMTLASPRPDAVAEIFRVMEGEAHTNLAAGGFAPDKRRIIRSVDARYVGQLHELIVPVADGPIDLATLTEARAGFDRLHRERFTYALADNQVEFLHWRVTAIGVNGRPAERSFDELSRTSADPALIGIRRAYFREYGEYVDTNCFRASDVPAGADISGPALIDSTSTTIVVVPGQRVKADGRNNFLIDTGVDRAPPERPFVWETQRRPA